MFNPHANRTSDGVVITVGLAVTDYDRNPTTVVGDATSPERCEPGYCKGDHWFETANGGRFNGTRMETRRVGAS